MSEHSQTELHEAQVANERVLVALVARIGAKALSDRVMLASVTLLTFGLFCWVMYAPTYERIGAAALFTVTVFRWTWTTDRDTRAARQMLSHQEK